jgi:predicted transcriptional regulator
MASDSSVERHANTVSVLTALRIDEGSRLAELAQRTGLSRPTVDSILTELGRLGWVEQRDPEDPPGGARQAGRPARTYRLNPDAGFVVGVDVGVNLLTAMVADITGTTRHTVTRPIGRATPGAERRTAVQSLVADAVAELGVEPRETLALSLGVPGIVDPSGRVTLSTVIPDWTGFHVERHFGRWAGVPVTVANDANMATLAEHWIGAARLSTTSSTSSRAAVPAPASSSTAGCTPAGTAPPARSGASPPCTSAPRSCSPRRAATRTPPTRSARSSAPRRPVTSRRPRSWRSSTGGSRGSSSSW